ncbi:MAG: hypothetical protein AAGD11_05835 [Planctomycetota bacterium]
MLRAKGGADRTGGVVEAGGSLISEQIYSTDAAGNEKTKDNSIFHSSRAIFLDGEAYEQVLHGTIPFNREFLGMVLKPVLIYQKLTSSDEARWERIVGHAVRSLPSTELISAESDYDAFTPQLAVILGQAANTLPIANSR